MATQADIVEEVMRNNGGYASFTEIFEEVLKIDRDKFSSPTYKNSIKCLVQRDKNRFFRINFGLWGLVSEKDNLPEEIKNLIDLNYVSNYDKALPHAIMQANLINIGKSLGFCSYIPSQDKTRTYDEIGKRLIDIVDTFTIPKFTYPEIINQITSIDVIWFSNIELGGEQFSFPKAIFEIESSTNFRRSLEKFNLLLPFNLQYMFIVAPECREKQFNKIINMDDFKQIKSLVKFLRYEDIDTFLANPQLLLKFNII